MVNWSDDEINSQLAKLGVAPSAPTTSRFAPTKEAPRALTTSPAPAPSRFASISKVAKKGFMAALSGESFLVDAGLVDQSTFDNMNPYSRFAIDNLASPIGLASLIAAPFTGGGSIAARTGLAASLAGKSLGKVALRTGVEVGGQAAVDLTISGLATGAAKATDYALKDADPRVRSIGALTVGLLTGVAGGKSIGKIFKPSVAEGVRSSALLAAEDVSLPAPASLTHLMSTIGGDVPDSAWAAPLRTLTSAVDPTKLVRTTLGKMGVARFQAEKSNHDLANTWLVGKFGAAVQDLTPNSKGQLLIGNQLKPWRDALDPANYDALTPLHKASVNRLYMGLDEAITTHNVYSPTDRQFGLDELWVPRFDKDGKIIYSNSQKFRELESNAIGARFTKADVERPDALLYLYSKTALDAQLDYQFNRSLAPYLRSADEVFANSPDGRAKYAEMVSDQQRVETLRENYAAAVRRERGATAARRGDINTTRALRRNVVQELDENKQSLADMLYTKVWSPRGGQILDPFDGETGQEFGLRKLIEEITGEQSLTKPIGNPGSMAKYGPIGRQGEVGVQSSLAGFDVPPVSTFTEPVVPRVPHSIRQLLTDGKEELRSIKAEEKILAKGRSIANKMFYAQAKGENVNQSAINQHLSDRLTIEKRIFELQDRRAEIEARLEQLDQASSGVKLARISGTKPSDIARYKLQNAEYNSKLTSQNWSEFKKTTTIEEASSKLFDLPGEERTGSISKLGEAYVFEREEDLAELLKWTQITRHAGEPVPGLSAVQQIADAARFTSASLDMSAGFINLLPIMFSHPTAWGKAVASNWKSVLMPRTASQVNMQIRYMQNEDNYRIITDMIRNNLVPGDVENFVSAARGGLVSKAATIPGVGGALNQTYGRAQRGYELALMTARVEVWRALENIPDFKDNPSKIADFIREATGAIDTGRMGVSPSQRTIESIIFFSPRMFRSTMALMADAVRPWTPEGQLAAHTVLKMLGAGAGLFAVANGAIGMMNGEDDEQISKRIEEAMNPTLGRQFLSIKVGDQYYGIGGTVRAMSQAIARGITNNDSGRGNPIWEFIANRQGPAARAFTSGMEAMTGDDWAPYQKVDNWMDWTTAQGKAFFPFYLQNLVSEGTMPGAPLLVDIAGLSSRARTSTDILDSESYQRHDRPWNDLTDTEQAAIKADHPELEAKAAELLTKEKIMFNDAIKAVNNTTNNDLIAVNNLSTTTADKRERIQTVLRDRWVQNKRLYETFTQASNQQPANSDAQRVTEAYFKTFDDASLSTGGNQTDWTKWEENQADLQKRIASGEFGEPVRAQQVLDERSKFELPPELAWYSDASKVIKNANYWGQKDIAFDEVRNLVQNSFPEIDSARALTVAMDNAPDPVTLARLKALSKVVDTRTTGKRKLLKAKSKELADALKAMGY